MKRLLTLFSIIQCLIIPANCGGKTENQRDKDFQSRLFSLATSANGNQQNQNQNNDSFYIGGTVTGLDLSNNLILRNNNAETLTINLNGVFKFPNQYKNGSSYSVTVLVQPATKFCTIPNGVGSISGTDVLSILITCQ